MMKRDQTNLPKLGCQELITALQREATNILTPLIPDNAEIILLDYPNNTNVGDSLIWLGEVNYLKNRKLKIRHVSDLANYNSKAIRRLLNEHSIILMHGGGNFGTVWKEIHQFRLKVLSDFAGVKIIQLPQTIFFDNERELDEMREAIKRHKNFTLLARCQKSYHLAAEYFEAPLYLCPDMAFFIGALNTNLRTNADYFVLARTDHESSKSILERILKTLKNRSVIVDDWLHPSVGERLLHRIEMHTKWIRSIVDVDNILLYQLWNCLSQMRMRRGMRLLAQGNVVITDRLHAHILSLLMGKPHVLVDNNYGKLSGFYTTWTAESSLTTFIEEAMAESDFNHTIESVLATKAG